MRTIKGTVVFDNRANIKVTVKAFTVLVTTEIAHWRKRMKIKSLEITNALDELNTDYFWTIRNW